MTSLSRSLAAILLFLFSFAMAPLTQAAVQVHFYSREFGNQFPHAFIIVQGTLDASGEKVSANYGFTAASVAPAVLVGSVKGYVQALKPDYIAKADRKFTVTLNDAGYARLMAKVAEWQNRKQPAYNLNKANCVHFVMELAEVAGLKVNRASKLFKKPRSFLEEVLGLNPG
ncbi:MAG: hypothetical protein HC788_13975 [Sphingopyxis sp.]|nr:hypothetical protein [Sphingopyxis sp.]